MGEYDLEAMSYVDEDGEASIFCGWDNEWGESGVTGIKIYDFLFLLGCCKRQTRAPRG